MGSPIPGIWKKTKRLSGLKGCLIPIEHSLEFILWLGNLEIALWERVVRVCSMITSWLPTSHSLELPRKLDSHLIQNLESLGMSQVYFFFEENISYLESLREVAFSRIFRPVMKKVRVNLNIGSSHQFRLLLLESPLRLSC